MNKKYFCTFADSGMCRTLNRVKRQVEKAHYFDVVLINNENNLNENFRDRFKEKLIKGNRGFGYWVWKPQIILQTLDKMDEGDFLLYMDAGCCFNRNGISRMNEYFKLAENSPFGMIVFQEAKEAENKNLQVGILLESMWTKGDVFDFFGVRNNQLFYNTGQMVGGVHVVKKCKESIRIFQQWLAVFEAHFDLIDDSPSTSSNFLDFKEHRHDQSILSMICKKENIPSISAAELWQKDWNKLRTYPIWAKRKINLELTVWVRKKYQSTIRQVKKMKNLRCIFPFTLRIFRKELCTRKLYYNKGLLHNGTLIPYHPLGEGNLKIKELLLSGKPVMITRYGSVELETITKFLLQPISFQKHRQIDVLCHTAGFFPSNKKFIPQFIELYKTSAEKIDVLALWNCFHGRTSEIKLVKKWSHNTILVDLLSLEPFWYTEPWSECLYNKKVLLILPFEKSAKYQYENNREKLFANPKVLPIFKSLNVIRPPQGIGMSSIGGYNTWFDAYNDMCAKINTNDFDVAIIGAGAYGLPLAAFIKSIGKQAVHMGGATQLLFGIKGKRWEVEPWYLYQYKIYNEYWKRIDTGEVPKNTTTFENGIQGGYW
jgi:hypothetical protein